MKHLKYTVILIALSLLVLSGCSLPGLGDGNAKDDVKITTTETSETKIIANMEKLMIEHETKGKIKPTLIGNLGSSIINIMRCNVEMLICQRFVIPAQNLRVYLMRNRLKILKSDVRNTTFV